MRRWDGEGVGVGLKGYAGWEWRVRREYVGATSASSGLSQIESSANPIAGLGNAWLYVEVPSSPSSSFLPAPLATPAPPCRRQCPGVRFDSVHGCR